MTGKIVSGVKDGPDEDNPHSASIGQITQQAEKSSFSLETLTLRAEKGR
jgi:hypothetical protein